MYVKTKLVILYADSLKRDVSACYLIGRELEKSGYLIFIASRRNLQSILRIFVPEKIIFVGQINMISDFSFFESLVKNNTEIHFIPGEGYANDTEYETMYPKNIDYNSFENIFFWGVKPLQWFYDNRAITDKRKLIQAGNTKLEIDRFYKHTIKKDKTIGFVGRFVLLNDIYGRKPLFFLLNYLADSESNIIRANLEASTYACYGELFEYIYNETEYNISIRPHPNEDPSSYRFLEDKYVNRLKIDESLDVGEWFARCDKVVGQASSSFIDAYIVETPIICIDKYLNTMEDTLVVEPGMGPIYESCYLPESLDLIKSKIIENELRPIRSESLNSMLEENYVGSEISSIDAILEKVIDLNGRKKYYRDYFVKYIIGFTDAIYSIMQKCLRRKSILFNYSNVIHKIPGSLVKMKVQKSSKS